MNVYHIPDIQKETFPTQEEVDFLQSLPPEQYTEYSDNPAKRRMAASVLNLSKLLSAGRQAEALPSGDEAEQTPETHE